MTLGGLVGVSALTPYTIGSDATLRLDTTLGITAGSSFAFTAPDSHLVLGNGVDLGVLNTISGFGPGSTIDVPEAATRVLYTANSGSNNGGTLALLDSSGTTVTRLALSDGTFVPANFSLTTDGRGRTIVNFSTTVASVTVTPQTADLTLGAVVLLQVDTTSPVTVSGGTPTLSLSDGGIATYDPASSTSTQLVFKHIVQAGENTPDLSVTGINLNGALVMDAGGDAANLSAAITNPTGTLQIDTTAPIVTALSMTPGTGTGEVTTGQTVEIDVGLSEHVTVSGGTPTLSLNDGGTATYDPAMSNATTLAFKYIVQAGQNTSDLGVIGVAIDSATVADPAGNAANLSGAVGTPAAVLQVQTDTSSGGSGTPSGNALAVYRFYDTVYGTHLFTQSASEAKGIIATRPDLVEETNGFGAVAQSNPSAEAVYRLFNTANGTHFFTASYNEFMGLTTPGTATYRPDLSYEPGSTFYEDSTQQAGDVAVFRLFDTTHGTQFLTGNQSEYAGLTTPGSASYRPDLTQEGIAFYAPSGNFAA